MAGKSRKRWIQAALSPEKKGALHRQLGIPEDTVIPLAVLKWAADQPGVLGRRARMALTLRKIVKRQAVTRQTVARRKNKQ